MADQCRSCGAEVVFVPSATSGKPMILDAKPELRIVLVNNADIPMRSPSPMAINDAKARVMQTYVDHHATCPSAGQWKGRTR